MALRPEMGLRQGDVIVLHVIKQLTAGKWVVAIRGRVYPASSELPLQAGSTLHARVSATEGKLALVVSDVAQDAVSVALQGQGMPAGGVEEIIARALARNGLPILAETILKVKALLARTPGMDTRRGARSAASLLDRRIDPGSAGARALLPVLGFGQKGGEDPRRYRGRPLPDTPKAVKEFAATLCVDPATRSSALQAYNHIQGKSQTWVVIPFLFTSGDQRLAGTMKILYNPFLARPLAFALSTEGIDFHLPLQGKRRALAIYCDDDRLKSAASRGLDSLRSKFHNMGWEVDDIIKEGDAFDGFSPVEEGESLPSVDTVG